jgi:hypothetical protein
MYFAATSQDNKTTYIQSGYNSLLNNLRPVIIGTIEIAHHLYQYGADQYLHSQEDWQERWMVWVAGDSSHFSGAMMGRRTWNQSSNRSRSK